MDLDKLIDLNLSYNPITTESDYQNRVKEMLSQVKFIDDFNVEAIEPDLVTCDRTPLMVDEYQIAEIKQFVLSKFTKFPCFKVQDLLEWADEALQLIHEEDDEQTLIIKKVKRHDRKSETFQKETFEVFDYEDDTDEIESDDNHEDRSEATDTKKHMWRS